MRHAGATLRLFAHWLHPTTICGGTDFLCPLFLSRKALYLRASAFFLVDAAGHIFPIFAL